MMDARSNKWEDRKMTGEMYYVSPPQGTSYEPFTNIPLQNQLADDYFKEPIQFLDEETNEYDVLPTMCLNEKKITKAQLLDSQTRWLCRIMKKRFYKGV